MDVVSVADCLTSPSLPLTLWYRDAEIRVSESPPVASAASEHGARICFTMINTPPGYIAGFRGQKANAEAACSSEIGVESPTMGVAPGTLTIPVRGAGLSVRRVLMETVFVPCRSNERAIIYPCSE